MSPLISIVTRHIPSRGEGFERLVKSLLAQTSQDYQHLVIYNEPLGLLDANQSLACHADEVTGDYVLIVDDDDYLIYSEFIEELLRVLPVTKPDVVMVRLDFMGKPFPNDVQWLCLEKLRQAPVHGQISSSNYIIKREIWRQHIHAFGVSDSGDYHFISDVYTQPILKVAFWNRAIVAVDHIGKEEVRGNGASS